MSQSFAAAEQARAPPEIRNVVSFLRSGKAGMKVRVGAFGGKRVDYFKGKSAIKAVLSPAYAKLTSVPKVTSEAEAIALLFSITRYAFFVRVDRGLPTGSSSSSPKLLSLSEDQNFLPGEYFAWFYDGSQWTTYVGGLLMVAVMLGAVMFPLWPSPLRLGVWYLSTGMLGLIGLFFAIAIVRLIFYVITVVVASPGIWVFPQLFADVGFVESFIPLWDWDIPKKKTRKKKADKTGEKKKGKAPALQGENGIGGRMTIEEVDDSEHSRPASRARAVTVEDVPEDE